MGRVRRPWRRGRWYPPNGWRDSPSGTFWSKWLGGVGGAIFFAAAAVDCWVSGRSAFMGRRLLELKGAGAIAYGVGLFGVAVFIHFHYFWGATDRLTPLVGPGRLAGMGLAAIGFGFAMWSIFSH